MTDYWNEGSNSGFINDNKTLTCTQGAVQKVWGRPSGWLFSVDFVWLESVLEFDDFANEEWKYDEMANQTIYAHPVSYLSWSSSSSVTAVTETSTTVVTNSSGDRVYWNEGSNSGFINNNKTLTCTQGPVQKVWDFSTQSSGGPQITLTISSSGGG